MATVHTEVAAPDPPFNLVAGPIVTPVPEDAQSVTVTFQVLPGTFRLSVFGHDEVGNKIAESAPVNITVTPGQVLTQRIQLLSLAPPAPPGPPNPAVSPTATSLTFAVQPSVQSAAGTVFSAQVAVLDQNGNLFPTATSPITLALGSNPTSTTLLGSPTATPVNGVAVFSNLVVAAPSTGYTLVATSTGLTGATSAAFEITPPLLQTLAVTPNPVALVGLTPQQLTATGTFSDNSSADVTASSTWSSDNPAVATVTPTGLVSGTGTPGTANISATRDGITASVPATVAVGSLPPGNRAFSTPNQADSTILLDVNGDGRDDVIMTGPNPASRALFQLLTQADGTLGAASTIYTDPTNSLNRLIKGNLDNLNGIDFVLLKNDEVTVFLSNGAGGFAATDVATLIGGNIWGDLGDIDADGDLDLVTNVGLNDLQTLFNNGAGVLAPGATIALGAGGQGVTLSDFDGDGLADIGVVVFPHIRVYPAGAGGVFGPFTNFGIPLGGNGLDLKSGNLDGVNGNDMVFNDSINQNIWLMLNDGTGNFPATTAIFNSPGVFRLGLANVDGVNGLDIGVTNIFQDSLTVLFNSGAATFTASSPTAIAGSASEFDFGNLDGLNGPDAVAASVSIMEPGASVFLNQGGGYLAYPFVLGPNEGTNYSVLADLDGSNGLDVASVNSLQNRVEVIFNQGGGTFSAFNNFPVGINPTSVVAADFNRDGRIDLVTANSVGADLSLLLNNGAGFNPAVPIAMPGALNPTVVISADFDGLNGPDLAVIDSLQLVVRVLLNNGSGGVAAQNTFAVGNGPSFVQAADFDGVNGPDLAVANADDDNLRVLRNNGAGTSFATTVLGLAGGVSPTGLAAGDFDGVNGPDLAASNTGTNNVSVLLNQGAGTFAGAVNFPLVVGGGRLVAGDLNADGILDLITGLESLQILVGQAGGAFAAPLRYALSNPGKMAIGDLNADGINDIAAPAPGNASVPGKVILIFGQ